MKRSGKGLFSAVLKRNEVLSPACRLLMLERPMAFPDALPGQFVSIRVSEGSSPLLRRPYSILDLTGSSLSLLVKVVGRGSALLAAKRPGERIDVLGPLGGTAFPAPEDGIAVFVAGGTGLAPVIHAARRWRRTRAAKRMYLLYGAETRDELLSGLARDSFTRAWYATMDGSAGFRGDVVRLCSSLLRAGKIPVATIYSCGPRGMVRALVSGPGRRFAAHWTSLETVMACGLGACRGCTVPVRAEAGSLYRAVCSDGTVFDAEAILWEEWEE